MTFFLAAAFSGVQQEIARSVEPRVAGTARGPDLRVFAAAAAAAAAIVILASSPAWSAAAFPAAGRGLALPLAVAVGSYIVEAVVGGILYGLGRWTAIFWLITLDGGLRFVAIASTLAVSDDQVALAWAVAAPFPIAAAIVGLAAIRHDRGRFSVDVGMRALTWNSLRTVVASASMGLLVSGFPFLLSVTSSHEDRARFGFIVLLATLTRAPLIVVGLSLQSFLVVFFKARADAFGRSVRRLLVVVAAIGVVLAALAWLLGPWVFGLLLPNLARPDGGLLGGLVLSSALVGGLCVTAPALLSRSHHGAFTAGWLVAAVGTIVALLLPLPLVERVMTALAVGPAIGLAVHVVVLVAGRSARRTEDATGRPA